MVFNIINVIILDKRKVFGVMCRIVLIYYILKLGGVLWDHQLEEYNKRLKK